MLMQLDAELMEALWAVPIGAIIVVVSVLHAPFVVWGFYCLADERAKAQWSGIERFIWAVAMIWLPIVASVVFLFLYYRRHKELMKT